VNKKSIENLIWILVYGGLLLCSLGIFVWRLDSDMGLMLVAAGVVLSLSGAGLVYVRSRMKNGPP
jgi:hypothetical protein